MNFKEIEIMVTCEIFQAEATKKILNMVARKWLRCMEMSKDLKSTNS